MTVHKSSDRAPHLSEQTLFETLELFEALAGVPVEPCSRYTLFELGISGDREAQKVVENKLSLNHVREKQTVCVSIEEAVRRIYNTFLKNSIPRSRLRSQISFELKGDRPVVYGLGAIQNENIDVTSDKFLNHLSIDNPIPKDETISDKLVPAEVNTYSLELQSISTLPELTRKDFRSTDFHFVHYPKHSELHHKSFSLDINSNTPWAIPARDSYHMALKMMLAHSLLENMPIDKDSSNELLGEILPDETKKRVFQEQLARITDDPWAILDHPLIKKLRIAAENHRLKDLKRLSSDILITALNSKKSELKLKEAIKKSARDIVREAIESTQQGVDRPLRNKHVKSIFRLFEEIFQRDLSTSYHTLAQEFADKLNPRTRKNRQALYQVIKHFLDRVIQFRISDAIEENLRNQKKDLDAETKQKRINYFRDRVCEMTETMPEVGSIMLCLVLSLEGTDLEDVKSVFQEYANADEALRTLGEYYKDVTETELSTKKA